MVCVIWGWLSKNSAVLGVIVAVLPVLWAILQYITIQRAKKRRVLFKTFHNLIQWLVDPKTPEQSMKLDRQIAVIYELRRFKSYYPVTLRTLRGLKKDWTASHPRLIEEIDLAIEYIQRRTWFRRVVLRRPLR